MAQLSAQKFDDATSVGLTDVPLLASRRHRLGAWEVPSGRQLWGRVGEKWSAQSQSRARGTIQSVTGKTGFSLVRSRPGPAAARVPCARSLRDRVAHGAAAAPLAGLSLCLWLGP